MMRQLDAFFNPEPQTVDETEWFAAEAAINAYIMQRLEAGVPFTKKDARAVGGLADNRSVSIRIGKYLKNHSLIDYVPGTDEVFMKRLTNGSGSTEHDPAE